MPRSKLTLGVECRTRRVNAAPALLFSSRRGFLRRMSISSTRPGRSRSSSSIGRTSRQASPQNLEAAVFGRLRKRRCVVDRRDDVGSLVQPPLGGELGLAGHPRDLTQVGIGLPSAPLAVQARGGCGPTPSGGREQHPDWQRRRSGRRVCLAMGREEPGRHTRLLLGRSGGGFPRRANCSVLFARGRCPAIASMARSRCLGFRGGVWGRRSGVPCCSGGWRPAVSSGTRGRRLDVARGLPG